MAHNLDQRDTSIVFDDDFVQTMATRAGLGQSLVQTNDEFWLVFKSTPGPGTLTGVGGYLTFYVPTGRMEVVEAAYLMPTPGSPGDAHEPVNFTRIPVKGQSIIAIGSGPIAPAATASLAGLTLSNAFGQAESVVTAAGVHRGTIAGVYADTGIFFSRDPRTAWQSWSNAPASGPLSRRGYPISMVNNRGETITPITRYDAEQLIAYGRSDQPPVVDPNGRGNTPWGLGNVVSGPNSGYSWEFNLNRWADSGSNMIAAVTNIGPWQRIKYPGSQYAKDQAGLVSSVLGYAGEDASSVGYALGTHTNLGEATLPADANAVRFSYGMLELGRPEYAAIRVRIKSAPSTECFAMNTDAFGGDAGGEQGGKDHEWRYYDPTVATLSTCTFLSKVASDPLVKPGDLLHYTISFANNGSVPLPNITLTDLLPAGVTFLSSVPPQSSGPNPLVWNLGTVGSNTLREIQVNVKAASLGTFQNTVVATSGTTTVAQATETIEVSYKSLLREQKTVTPSTIAPGGTVTYTITVYNEGTGPNGVPLVVREYLPTGFTYGTLQSAQINGASLPLANVTVNASNPNAPTFTVGQSIQADKTLVLVFTAAVSASQAVGTYYNEVGLAFEGKVVSGAPEAPVTVGGGQIGDFIWRDWDGDGVQDSGEEGMSNVTVTLLYDSDNNGSYETLIGTKTTDASGAYLFTGLAAGNYFVYVPTPGTDGVPSAYTLTGDPNGPPATTNFVRNLGTNEQYLGADWGYRPAGTGSIGDLVYEDKNGDGLYNGTDTGISNVTVWLYEDSNGNGIKDSGDVLVATTNTGVGGIYAFTGLATNISYLVDVDESDADLIARFAPNPFNATTPALQPVPSLSGTYNGADFGYIASLPSSIGDTVFLDINGNGTYNASTDAPLPGVTVTLYRDSNGDGVADGPALSNRTTDVNGQYLFTGLAPDTYLVVVDSADADIPAGSSPSVSQYVVPLPANTTYLTADFPFVRLLDKSVDKASAQAGDSLTYSITANYPGCQLLSNLKIADPVPTGFTVTNVGQGGTTGAYVPLPAVPGEDVISGIAVTTNLAAVADAWIANGSRIGNNYGGSTDMGFRNDGNNNLWRPLLRFPISDLPARAAINAATMTLYCVTYAGTEVVSAYRLSTNWIEGVQNGVASTTSVTWNVTGYSAWTTLGGTWVDADGTDQGFVPYATNMVTAVGYYSWDIGAMVDEWQSGLATNFGVILIGDANQQDYFASRENATAANRPVLTVNYTPLYDVTNSVKVSTNTAAIGSNVQVRMTLFSATTISNVYPGALTLRGGTGTISSPSPAGPFTVAAGVATTVTWTVTVGAQGIYTFEASATNATYTFPSGTSDSILVTPGGAANVVTWQLGSNTEGVPGEKIISGYPGGVYGFKGAASSFSRYALDGGGAGTWSSLASAPGTEGAGASMVNSTTGVIYALLGGSTTFSRYSLDGNSWSNMAATPAAIGYGAGIVRAYSNNTPYYYTPRGGNQTAFYRYDPAANTWATMAAPPGGIGGSSAGGVAATSNFVFVLRGNKTTTFYRYAAQSNSWSTMAPIPLALQNGGALVTLGDYVYGMTGNGKTNFYRYSITSNTWTQMTGLPVVNKLGGALTTDGVNIYAFSGNATANFLRYNVAANTWTSLTAPNFGTVTTGGALTYAPGVALQGYFGTMQACPTAVASGTTVTVTMRLNSSVALTNVVPGTMSITSSNGATATFLNGPIPSSTNIAASGTVSYAWTYTVKSGANPGSVTFAANATGYNAGSLVTFTTNVANSVLALPTFTFSGTVQNPPGVSVIRNTAFMAETGGTIPNVESPTTETALIGSIGDFVWYDQDADGIQDAGEPGIAGVRVYIDSNGNGQYDSGETNDVTDTSGLYRMYGFAAGTYAVRYDYSTVPSGYLPTTPVLHSATLATGTTQYNSADFGLRAPGAASIGDTVWVDANTNGVRDAGETGLTNITIRLYLDADTNGAIDGGDFLLQTAATGTNGTYLFSGLATNAYLVQVDASSRVQSPYDGSSALSNAMSLVYGTNPLLVAITVTNQAYTNADFGYNWKGTIGDYVWWDANRDGLQNEPATNGLTNAVVMLFFDANTNGVYDVINGDYQIAYQTTDTNGFYRFTGLPPGPYFVDVYEDSIGRDGPVPTTANSVYVNLGAGQTNLTADFGYYIGARVEGNVFWDDNRSLVFDGGEMGLTNVTVYLNGTDMYGAPVSLTNRTDASGHFFFVAPEGDYTLTYSTPSLTSIYPSLTDPTTATNFAFHAVAGESWVHPPFDFGVDNSGRIGDMIFGDSNTNGAQNAGEPGLAGVTVYLYRDTDGDGTGDVLLEAQVTDGTGFYQFLGLADTTGTVKYLVQVATNTLPAGYQKTPTADPDVTKDSNYSTTLTGGATISIVDFGYPPVPGIYYSVSGNVWNDGGIGGGSMTNKVRDGAEPGFSHVTLNVYVDSNNDGTNDSVYVVLTDTNGNYSVSGIPSNSTVRIAIDESTLPSPVYAITPGMTNLLTVSNISSNRTGQNFGYYANYGSIAGTVVLGTNGNGVAESGELALSNVVVYLRYAGSDGILGSDDDVIQSTLTGTAGTYSFTNLLPGAYQVTKVNPTGLSSLADADQGNPDIIGLELNLGQNLVQQDFELTMVRGTIGDRIWLDENADGVQDAGEAGIANVRVGLYTTNGILLATTLSDANGGYLFSGLSVGAYKVKVDTNTLAAGLAANQTYDPDTTTNHETTVSISISAPDVTTADFGYNWAPASAVTGNTGTGAIGDRVWIDANGNGRQDAGEPGMGGVGVALLSDANGDGVLDTTNTTTTAADGSYIFDGLAAGPYVVLVNGGTTPTGYTATGDPDATRDNRTTTPIVLAPGDVYVNADFGYQPQANIGATIGDTVWFDADADGTLNGAEYGIAGVTVALIRDSNGNGAWDANEPIIATTVTATNGTYSFAGVPVTDGVGSDDYLVWVNDTAGVLTGLTQTYDKNGTGTASISAVTDLAPAGDSSQDFGYTAAGQTTTTGLIGDTIFLDRNTNLTFEAGEGVEGVTVSLYAANGTTLLATTVTDENGHYYFGGVANGTYIVKVSTNTLPGAAGQLTNTVDPDAGTANQSQVTISSSSKINLLQDFGYAAQTNPNRILGTIWEDLNANGVLVGTETGRFAGVTVALLDVNGNVVATTVTATNGTYAFTGLPNGTYTVDVTDDANLMEGYWHSLGTNGAAGNSQTDPYSVALSGGTTATVDYGYWHLGGALGNRVWVDLNNDGLQTAGEPGMRQSAVTLQVVYAGGPTNRVVTQTDTNGFYSFGYLLLDEGLPASGTGAAVYVLVPGVTATVYQATLVDVGGNIGTNDWIDSDSHSGVTGLAVRGSVDVSAQPNPVDEPQAASYDFGYKFRPTLARVTGFGAFSRDGAVIVRWQTAEERDTLGFWLERWQDGEYRRVNAALIPGQIFSVDGAVYEQPDAGAKPGGHYTYRLVEVETSGELRYLGPYTVTVDGATLSFDEWSRSVFDAAQQMNQAASGLDADPDGDGMNNFAEFIAGTDPADRNSALKIEGLDQATGGVVVRWTSVSNRTYSLEFSTNMAEGYQPYAAGIPATPPVNAQTCPVQPMPRTLFFRIITQ